LIPLKSTWALSTTGLFDLLSKKNIVITDKNIKIFGCSRILRMIPRKDHILGRFSMSLVERSLVSEHIIASGQEIHCPKELKVLIIHNL